MRIRLGGGFWNSRLKLGLLGGALLVLLIGLGIFTYYYIVYGRMIDQRLSGNTFEHTTGIFTAPGHIYAGQSMTIGDLTGYLQQDGYRENADASGIGRYSAHANILEIYPGKVSYFRGGNALRVEFAGKQIRGIRAMATGGSVDSAEIEPELLTNLFDESRAKRRPERFQDFPKVLVNSVLAAEDKRFFEHPGFDLIRVLGAAWADLRHGAVAQGASTLDMQLARSFFFSTERTWRRKLAETLVALELEHRYTKQQIFELYANEIYLGNRGSFAIHGFGEASLAYFGKDVRDLTLEEAAFLAGIIRRPNHYSTAEEHPDRAAESRDHVLSQMVEDKMITAEQMQAAQRKPLHLVRNGIDSGAAPYFVDMVKDDLLDHFDESELLSQNYHAYTTLDPQLQRAAVLAVDVGMKNVDTLLANKYARWKKELLKQHSKEPVPKAQVAMIVLDPKTGEIKALVGGRDYGQSQLNRALAKRQPGSSFKPFVYAAAFDDAVEGTGPIVTTITTVVDEPTTFTFDGKEYTPDNFGENFMGTVTLREALTHSLNVATVKVAELVGYGHVVEIARRMLQEPSIQATPAVALGAYDMTPLQIAAGYTAFANGGVRAEPLYLQKVVSGNGAVLEHNEPQTHQVLDPRVNYIVTNVLQDVINRGTGSPVRARGFTAPAAGKTGTSRDGWFAGYTSNLLCVVWVGFDDNRDLGEQGGLTAGPIWAEFMKRAIVVPGYQDVHDFAAPDGIARVDIDPETLELSTPACPVSHAEVFIAGTQPTEYCDKRGVTAGTSFLSKLGHLLHGNGGH
ncbi:MAG TPA: PBP1A family penicillin-binding protein [Candidatus Acidoferrales bacterium]|nr:PBP1A family penicillin-binding protein [Candidatus Acidoferrales bacterium]